MRDQLGVCQWFPFEAHADVERAVGLFRELGIRHVRTGISWADYHRPGGPAWYDWQMEALAEFEVLLCVSGTPPSLAEGACSAGPPLRLRDYADFIDTVLVRYGHQFADLELWNEPNNRLEWAYDRFDPAWRKFASMLGEAAAWAKQCRKRTVLGGMIPVDHHWLNLMKAYGALEHVDVVAIHGFPYMWWPDAPNWDWYIHWQGWNEKIAYISEHTEGRPVWITESGLATWDHSRRAPGRHQLQARCLRELADAPSERKYWCSLFDLDPARAAVEGFHVDENEYHLGLVTHEGRCKPAWETMRSLLGAVAQRRTAVG